MKFQAVLELHGKTATGITVPDAIVESLGAGKRPPVTVRLGPHTYRTTLAPMGGVYMIPVAAEHRDAAGLTAGETVEVEIELDTAPRTVDVPEDLKSALAVAGLAEAFAKLAYTHQKEHVRAIEEAKAPETRLRRIEKAVEMVRAKAA